MPIIRHPRTSAMIQTNYDRRPPQPAASPIPSSARPLQERSYAREDSDAFAAWLGHVQAGRIAVR